MIINDELPWWHTSKSLKCEMPKWWKWWLDVPGYKLDAEHSGTLCGEPGWKYSSNILLHYWQQHHHHRCDCSPDHRSHVGCRGTSVAQLGRTPANTLHCDHWNNMRPEQFLLFDDFFFIVIMMMEMMMIRKAMIVIIMMMMILTMVTCLGTFSQTSLGTWLHTLRGTSLQT